MLLDAATGKEKWKAEGSVLEQTYGTPAIHRVDENRSDLIVAATGEIWGLNPDTGKLRWLSETKILGNVSSSPVIEGDTMVIFGGFPRTMGAALKLGLKGDVSDSARIWENVDVKSYMTAPLFHEGKLYFYPGRRRGLLCRSGERRIDLRKTNRKELPVTRVGGNHFMRRQFWSRDIFSPSAEPRGPLSSKQSLNTSWSRVNQIAGDSGRFQGTPAVSGGDLFLRSETALLLHWKSRVVRIFPEFLNTLKLKKN